jgi:ABC-type sugar transport system ATPase subunit
VALGRALVRRPRAFLFDEPLSSLDAQLRQELREELARLHRLTSTTSIYVTHDQKEALSLGDRVAVMRGGRLCQVAGPETIYRSPRDLFVARFVGEPPINLIEGTAEASDGGGLFRAAGFYLKLAAPPERTGGAVLGLRPEAVAVGPPTSSGPHAELERVEHLGGDTLIHVRGPWGTMVIRAGHAAAVGEVGAPLAILPDPARALLFAPDGERI